MSGRHRSLGPGEAERRYGRIAVALGLVARSMPATRDLQLPARTHPSPGGAAARLSIGVAGGSAEEVEVVEAPKCLVQRQRARWQVSDRNSAGLINMLEGVGDDRGELGRGH